MLGSLKLCEDLGILSNVLLVKLLPFLLGLGEQLSFVENVRMLLGKLLLSDLLGFL